ncbi:hypothetical protein PM082_011493 [Marasmius tenuissimus]|nr:hypothetical protein PM082_011493 [Marasmius tenuissimus]
MPSLTLINTTSPQATLPPISIISQKLSTAFGKVVQSSHLAKWVSGTELEEILSLWELESQEEGGNPLLGGCAFRWSNLLGYLYHLEGLQIPPFSAA